MILIGYDNDNRKKIVYKCQLNINIIKYIYITNKFEIIYLM